MCTVAISSGCHCPLEDNGRLLSAELPVKQDVVTEWPATRQSTSNRDDQLPGKSIVFARNHKHAMLLQSVFDEMFPQFGGKFCKVIDNYDPRAEQLIDDFKGDDKTGNLSKDDEITIAISVDMLYTGIDVPSVVNLVFAKPVKSKVKFWQMIGRGTRLCPNLFGSGQDKQKFVIFDHWGNFEYHSLEQEEKPLSQSKPLAQKRLEAWVELAKAAQKKFDQPSVKAVASQLKNQIQALDENSIAVREKWEVRDRLNNDKVLSQFTPQTQQLVDEIGPLMQWVDVRGQGNALRFDMEMIAAQTAVFSNRDRLPEHRVAVIERLDKLPVHLGQVQQHGELINSMQELDWWQNANFAELEHARMNLRGIMHLMEEPPLPPPPRLMETDIKEDAAKYEVGTHKVNIKSVDFKIFRQQVQGALEPMFTSNPVLVKIRNAQPVQKNEMDELIKLVLIQNPNVDIRDLKEFYPKAAVEVDQLLRTFIGMDSAAVAEKFASLILQFNFNSQQIRFLDMLKNHIRDYGTIEMAQLFDKPFTQIHGEGITGLFPDMTQVMAIKQIVDSLNVPTGEPAS